MAAALAKTWGIGYQQNLPWHIPADSEYLEVVTSKAYNSSIAAGDYTNIVIMGRLSWESIPMQKIPMKRRFNIVISRDPLYNVCVLTAAFECILFHPEEADLYYCLDMSGNTFPMRALQIPYKMPLPRERNLQKRLVAESSSWVVDRSTSKPWKNARISCLLGSIRARKLFAMHS